MESSGFMFRTCRQNNGQQLTALICHFHSVVFGALFAVTTLLCLQAKSHDRGWHLSLHRSDLFDHSPLYDVPVWLERVSQMTQRFFLFFFFNAKIVFYLNAFFPPEIKYKKPKNSTNRTDFQLQLQSML